MPLSIQLQGRIDSFLADHDLGHLYREYRWHRDTWDNGFPDMRQLEVDLTMAAKHGYLTKAHIMAVAEWGGMRNINYIKKECPKKIEISLYNDDDNIAESSSIDASAPLKILQGIKGLGPTYQSKVLMFSRPQLYGAIDTNLVRVFGHGDSHIEGLNWLSLEVKDYGSGPFIPKRKTWPDQYNTWIEILRHIRNLYNTSGHQCPHPDEYIDMGLREKGIWIIADIETALFSYAYNL